MERIKQFLKKMSASGYDAFLAVKPENVSYLTHFTGDSSHLMVSETGTFLLTDGRYSEQARMECPAGVEVLEWLDNERYGVKTYAYVLQKMNAAKLGFESNVLSYADYLKLSAGLTDASLIATTDVIDELRMIKDDDEIAFLRKACQISDAALQALIPSIKPGVSELELTATLEYQLRMQGAEDISFATIVLSGSKTSLLHGHPGTKKLENGEFLLFDFGALYKGYHADISRTLVVGKASDRHKQVYAMIREAQEKAVFSIRDGVVGNTPDAVVRETLSEEYLPYYYPGMGHGVGLEIHEQPFIKKGCDTVFKTGMVVTVEPGVYIPGWGGLRIEDTILVRDGEPELLTNFPKELMEV
ncbi:MAG: aminopeptidase P family protein [Bacteroidales bacterium]|nr:aminopeptidase P family protein [Bacteroidales bacterium]